MSSSSATLDRSVSLPPAKKHKRSSSGDLSVKQLDSLAVGLRTISDKIKEVQAQYQWGDLEELDHLAEETDIIIKQVKRFQNLKKEWELRDDKGPAVIVSLSNMDRQILSERLGMQEPKIIGAGEGSPVDFLDKLLPVMKAQSESRHLDTITDTINRQWDQTSLFATLSTIKESVNTKSEAASRTMIDAWLLQGMQLIKRVNKLAKPVLFPELLIWSRNSESDDPPVIEYNNQVTYLTGSTDYGLLSVLPSGRKVVPVDKFEHRLLNNENATRALHFFTPNDTLNIYEAKRVSKSLEAHEAQVIAQCLAIMAKLNAVASNQDSKLQNLAFTLTSGAVWVFGVVDAEGKACFRTAEMQLDTDIPTAKRPNPSFQALMTLILIWSTQSSGTAIKAAMSTL